MLPLPLRSSLRRLAFPFAKSNFGLALAAQMALGACASTTPSPSAGLGKSRVSTPARATALAEDWSTPDWLSLDQVQKELPLARKAAPQAEPWLAAALQDALASKNRRIPTSVWAEALQRGLMKERHPQYAVIGFWHGDEGMRWDASPWTTPVLVSLDTQPFSMGGCTLRSSVVAVGRDSCRLVWGEAGDPLSRMSCEEKLLNSSHHLNLAAWTPPACQGAAPQFRNAVAFGGASAARVASANSVANGKSQSNVPTSRPAPVLPRTESAAPAPAQETLLPESKLLVAGP